MATIKAAEKLSNGNFYIVLSLITLLILGGTILAGKSLFGAVVLNTKVVNAKNLASSHLQTNLDAAPNLVDAYLKLGPQSDLIDHALPSTEDYPGLIAMLENIAASSGVKLSAISRSTTADSGLSSSVRPASTTSAPAPQKLEFNISVKGSYANVNLKLLAALESAARPMHVNSVQLSGTGSDISATLDVATYYQAKATLPITKETIK